MQMLRRRVGRSLIAGLTCTLTAGCAQQPVASGLRPEAVGPWNAPPPVAVSYATQRSSDVAVASGSVDFESARFGRYAHVEEMLVGRVAGLEVLRRADGRFSLHVRGPVSMMGSGEPLLVVDGMPINGDAAEVLGGLSPGDVQHVDVLKDAGTTAIYGSRGANGVVVITTRRAR